MAIFWPKLTVLRVFDLLPNAAMNLPNFCYGTSLNFESFRGTNRTVSCYIETYLVVLFWKIECYSPGKIYVGSTWFFVSQKPRPRIPLRKETKICNHPWKIQAKNSKNGQILNTLQFSRHAEYDFLKEDYKNNFRTKNLEDL